MDWWIVTLALLVGILLLLVLVPLTLRVSVQGRGDPTGSWALAGGGQLGPLAISGVAARGVTATVQVHVFGRRLWQRRLRELAASKQKASDDEEGALARAEREVDELRGRYARLERFFDPVDLLAYGVGELRRVRFEQLDVELGYSFQDVALTGKVMAAIYVLNGALPPRVVIRQNVSWESVDQAELQAAGAIKLWPGLLVLDTFWYVLKNVRLRRRKAPARPRRESTSHGEERDR